ncbi:ornithine cyclodeaminase [Aliiroseovarius halocynthiae]|uniref:2,3-diaminopropionate biosynthesis protein SbnB n=1 Tax=Aliiroseovarius halocynthiae TaxID=985055 RepID=A0A545SW63_9RHOB|nr:2,3-diaminopropionate biosynthesis protein SbnB [Aliiroseovarius halocynthiae]TQV69194.1 2,3-diaminopropionate biosynthesis protein SbnB [Aliiroseovarius halocynthiae]SMR71960.1 ornithine cyclodeaminase [Aliiroseovarius halocynthiae]
MTTEYLWRNASQLQYVAANDINHILQQNRSELIDLVAKCYATFYDGHAINPDTYSLKFPQKPNSRINALPAYVGEECDLAGLKWVASFPDNVAGNLQRASASIILNSFQTGYPLAILDGTLISSARTVASAALAARCLRPEKSIDTIAFYGAGVINRHLLEFLRDDQWSIAKVVISDLDPGSATRFIQFCEELGYSCENAGASFASQDAEIISFATSALEPWYDLEVLDHQVLLHMSLRDILPARLKPVRNIVDDVNHAVKANTSLHLLEQSEGSIPSIENFSRILQDPPQEPTATVVSAFGMGLLDVAFGGYVMNKAEGLGHVSVVPDFLPSPHRW